MLSRSLEKAKEAYKSKNAKASAAAHGAGGMPGFAPELHQTAQGQYLKSMVYGGLDGIITTFAVVAGVAGAALSPGIVLIMGFANLIGDGISMAIGDFLSSKAERDYNRAEREREKWEVENYPEGEKRELVELYSARGVAPADAKAMVDIIAKTPKAWVDTMMVEELGIIESDESPVKNALVTFASFLIFGFIPVLAYVLSRFLPIPAAFNFPSAAILTGATLFCLGAVKTRFTGQNWFVSGFEMLAVGGLASAAAYFIGLALGSLA
jgi:vacuolar iron transporter family protein